MNGVSIIICCFNSKSRLSETLLCLTNQITSNLAYEIVLIDNASTDDTSEFAASYWKELNSAIPFQLLEENRTGKTYAIEKGIQASQFDLILFCDDDNHLSQRYVQDGFEYFNRHPNVALLGGKGIPKLPSVYIPEWFERYQHQYAVGSQGAASGDISITSGFVYGAGSFLKKHAFEKLKKMGFNYTLTGRRDGIITPGEDNELGYALSLIGYTVHYCDTLIFTHCISHNRLEWRYIKNLKRRVAYSSVLLIPYSAYRRLLFEGTPISFSWTTIFLKTLRVLFTNMLRYPFATASYKIDIALDSQARLGTLHALIDHRQYLQRQKDWLPWLKKVGLGKY